MEFVQRVGLLPEIDKKNSMINLGLEVKNQLVIILEVANMIVNLYLEVKNMIVNLYLEVKNMMMILSQL